MTLAPAASDGPIIVFDGWCVLCSGWARFVLRHDTNGIFHLLAMQSPLGTTLAERFGVDPQNPKTIIVVRGNTVIRDSDAILHIARHLTWPWRAFAAFAVIPRALRDPVYHLVARNRYRLLGRRDTCWLPDASERSRIL